MRGVTMKDVGLIVSFCIAAVIAQEPAEQDVTAEGTGLGANQAEALMNAKRDAVEKVSAWCFCRRPRWKISWSSATR
jgi:hypothetical protein